ncbi:MFS transporter [Leifsonia sp. H3M29-4]|uniref:MFS transporter n=1 Tax=Salinibacterium metalliresistens TaxID=3031321 RepID=UPI0023DC87B1|nr:MFS transporter [Salinibacterium metalliresistens]MDF1478473.1 MFS transporter [Salinibacterium metalliresistens]
MSDRGRRSAFAVCVIGSAVTLIEISKINVAVPAIEGSLGGGPTGIQLIVVGYLVTFALVLVPAGRRGDMRSRRSLFIAGLVLFGVAAVGCALAATAEMLIAFRLLQGVSAGIVVPQTLGIIQQLFRGAERGRALGVFGAVLSIALALGPTIGGVLIALGGPEFGWRLLFVMTLPIVVAIVPIAVRVLPRHQPESSLPRDLDPLGVALLAVATVALLAPFVLTTGLPGDDPARWLALPIAAAATAAFVWWERRYRALGRGPLVDLTLFGIAGYRNGILLGSAFYAAMPGALLVTALVLQQGWGVSAAAAGAATVPFALASAVSSWVLGKYTHRFGRGIVVAGVVTTAVGLAGAVAVTFLVPEAIVPWVVAGVLTVGGAGGGAVVAANQTLTLDDVEPMRGGVAASVGQVGQRIGTAVGTTIVTAVFYASVMPVAHGDAVSAYRDAYRNGAAVSLGLLAVAAVVAVVDQRRAARGSV